MQTLCCDNFYCVEHAHPHFNNCFARTCAPHLNFWWSHPQPHSHFFKKSAIFHHSFKNKNFLFNWEWSHYILLYSYKSFYISRFLEFNSFKTSFSCFRTSIPVFEHTFLFLNSLSCFRTAYSNLEHPKMYCTLETLKYRRICMSIVVCSEKILSWIERKILERAVKVQFCTLLFWTKWQGFLF